MIEVFTEKIIWTFSGATILLMFFYMLIRILFRRMKDNELFWSKLDYVSIFIGFIGLLSVINMDRLEYKLNEANYAKLKMEHYSFRILNSANFNIPCHDYDNERTSIKDSLSQNEISKICNWKKQIFKELTSFDYSDTIAKTPFELDNAFISTNYNIEQLKNNISTYNNSIEEIVFLNSWKFFKESWGLVLLIFAFALRLVITRRKVRKNVA